MEKIQDGITFYPEKAGVNVSTAPIVPIIDDQYVINANDIYWGKFDNTDIETTGQFINWIKSNKGIVGPNNNSNYYVITSSENISYPVDKEQNKEYTIGLTLYENKTTEKTISNIEVLNTLTGVKVTEDIISSNIKVIITKNTLIDNKAIFLKVSDSDNNVVIVKIPINIYETSETGQPIVQQSGKITVSGSNNTYSDISDLNFESGFDVVKDGNTANINVSTAAFVTTNGNQNIKGQKTFDKIKLKDGTDEYVILADGSTKKLSEIGGSGNSNSINVWPADGSNLSNYQENSTTTNTNTLILNSNDFKLLRGNQENTKYNLYVALSDTIKNKLNNISTTSTTNTTGINAIDLYKWDKFPKITSSGSNINIQENVNQLSFRITKNGVLVKDVTVEIQDFDVDIPTNETHYSGAVNKGEDVGIISVYDLKVDSNSIKEFYKQFKNKFPTEFNSIFKSNGNYLFSNSDEVFTSVVSRGKKLYIYDDNLSTLENSHNLTEAINERYQETLEYNEYAHWAELREANLNSIVRFGNTNNSTKGQFKIIINAINRNITFTDSNGNYHPTSNMDYVNDNLSFTIDPSNSIDTFYIYPILPNDYKRRLNIIITKVVEDFFGLQSNYPNKAELINTCVNYLTDGYYTNNSVIADIYSNMFNQYFKYGYTERGFDSYFNDMVKDYILEAAKLNIDLLQLKILEQELQESKHLLYGQSYLLYRYAMAIYQYISFDNNGATVSEELRNLRGRFVIVNQDIELSYDLKYENFEVVDVNFYINQDELGKTNIIADYGNPDRAYYEAGTENKVVDNNGYTIYNDNGTRAGHYNDIAYKSYHEYDQDFLTRLEGFQSLVSSGNERERYEAMYNRDIYEPIPEGLHDTTSGTGWFDDPTGEYIQIMYADLIKRKYNEIRKQFVELVGNTVEMSGILREEVLFITDRLTGGKHQEGSMKINWSDVIS